MFIRQISRLSFIFIAVISFSVNAQVNVLDNAKTLLLEAKKKTENTCFKAIDPQIEGIPKSAKSVLYRTSDSNGVLNERYESNYNDIIGVYISNAEGNFMFLKNNSPMIIKIPFKLIQMARHLEWIGSEDQDCTYSVTEDQFNDIPCYKITKKTPTDNAYLAKVTKKSIEYIAKNREKYIDSFVPVQVFYVGKSDHFIYSYTLYTINGRRNCVLDWGKIDFNAPINKVLFEIPQGIPIKKAKDLNDFIHLRDKLYELKKK